MTYEQFWHPLTAVYDAREAKAVARFVLEVGFGLSMTDVLCGRTETLSEQQLRQYQGQLLTGMPVQYVVGVADFGPRQFLVRPGVLIPRPETYELCQWVQAKGRVLDVGTGSGCIACTLAAEQEDVQTTAWDISEEALAVARENAKRTNVHVSFERQDALSPPNDHDRWDCIVSNPPYICQQERAAMERGVLDFEPHLALFVPNDDPLLFYRAIAGYARNALKTGGSLYFEINPLYARELEAMLRHAGFSQITTRTDLQGKERFTQAIKP